MDITCSGSKGTIYSRDMMSALKEKEKPNQTKCNTTNKKANTTNKTKAGLETIRIIAK